MPVTSWAQVQGANNDIRVAIVGLRGRGRKHIEGFRKLSGVRVVALCDVDSTILEREAIKFHKRGEQVDTFSDVRELLSKRDIDAVVVATPNHWHALITVWACQAGKDVYVEKPVSHNVWEGRQAVKAAERYDRIVQTGTQSRSATGVRQGVELVRSGELGGIRHGHGLCYKRRGTIGRVNGHQPVPGYVDYDLWTGPAPIAHMERYKLHYDWHWQWAYGNGDLGNQGIHEMDLCRWAMNESFLSSRVQSVGGRFGYVDDGQTPNSMITVHSFAQAPLYFEVRGLPEKSGSDEMPEFHHSKTGAIIQCESGSVVLRSNQARVFDENGDLVRTLGDAKEDHYGAHIENFIQAIRSRDAGHLHAGIEEGHLSSALCHTSNISYRLGVERAVEDVREEWKQDSVAVDALGRMGEHLQANDVDLTHHFPTFGPSLVMHPEEEIFLKNNDANDLLSREYRKGFEVPKRV